jgi:hypothetical protein
MKIAIDNNGRRMVENPLKIINGKYVRARRLFFPQL